MRVFVILIVIEFVICAVENMNYCVRMGLHDELEEWLKSGDDPNQVDAFGMCPLAWACKYSYFGIVQLLVKYGAKADQCRVNDGDTCLGHSIGYGNWHIAKLLLENGADPNIKDDDGYTPLHCALKLDRFTSVKMLIDHGANVDITFPDGLTPLGVASYHGAFDSAMYLVEHLGLDPYEAADSKGHNAIKLALSKGYEYLADAMEIHVRSMLLSCAQTDDGSFFRSEMVTDCTDLIISTFASQIFILRGRAYERTNYSFYFDP